MLNYKQLQHFWSVARAGGVTRASERLGLAPQTLSGQIAALESTLGVTLFRRQGRRLALTETGQMVLAYAEEIFQVGAELEDALQNRASGRAIAFRVGIADVVPKAVASLVLGPAMRLADPVRIVCREDKLEKLLGELAIHKLDIVLADRPLPSDMDVRGFSQLVFSSPVSLFASQSVLETLRGDFPANLDQAPWLLPGGDAALRRPLLSWLKAQRLSPRIVGEFDDSALMKSFGEAGLGIFPGPSRIADRIQQQYRVREVGRAEGVTEEVHLISVERKLAHPAVLAISTNPTLVPTGGTAGNSPTEQRPRGTRPRKKT